MSSRLEFSLAQGWALGLNCVFEDAESSLKLNTQKMAFLKQVHGTELLQVLPSNAAGVILGEGDGLWAQGDWLKEKKIALSVRSADCIPLLMVDPKNQAIAAIHAGWRGLLKKIHRAPFENLNCFAPENTWIWIGPSLNGNRFEVDEDMYSLFDKSIQQNSRYFSESNNLSGKKRFFYAWNYLEDEFLSLGVELAYNVEINTYEDPSFNSYRRSCHKNEKLLNHNISWIGFCESADVMP